MTSTFCPLWKKNDFHVEKNSLLKIPIAQQDSEPSLGPTGPILHCAGKKNFITLFFPVFACRTTIQS